MVNPVASVTELGVPPMTRMVSPAMPSASTLATQRDGLADRHSPTGGPRFPGGGVLTETWTGPQHVTVAVAGELDAFDRNALIDVLTATVLAGAREIVFDASAVSFADTAVLHAIEQVRRHLRRDGGSLICVGLETLAVGRAVVGDAGLHKD